LHASATDSFCEASQDGEVELLDVLASPGDAWNGEARWRPWRRPRARVQGEEEGMREERKERGRRRDGRRGVQVQFQEVFLVARK
jgi:hypothetical protein